jgi:TatD DNase family protein
VIDTHAHLDGLVAPVDEVLGRARSAGVDRIVTVGSGIESCSEALTLSEQHAGVFAALGIHPHQAGGPDAGQLDELRSLLAHPRAMAVGETGLDFYRDWAPRKSQHQLFASQLELAAELAKPVVIHCRDAEEAVAAQLDRFEGSVILHCFSSPTLLGLARERGWYVSFAGNITYPNAGRLREAARHVPAERLLAETDSPHLAPQPLRGRPNEPAHVVHVVAALAEARGDDHDELVARIEANAAEVFALP